MTTVWAIVGSIAAAGALMYVGAVLRHLVHLRPHVSAARRKAKQQTAIRLIEGLGTDDLLAEAQRGDPAAQTRIGLMYLAGKGVPRDDKKAFRWLERAASQGFVEAQYSVGLSYDRGRGTVQDFAKARSWYEIAAKNGDAMAQCNLGVLHLRGRGSDEDWITAAYWFLKAATQGRKEATANLEWILKRRDSLSDTASAVARYRNVAEEGDVDAQFLMGWLHEHGVGTVPNVEAALEWYNRARRLGHMKADDEVLRLKSSSTTVC